MREDVKQIVRLIYVSKALHLQSRQELDALLQVARKRNESSGVTGLLLYKDKSFIQLLEGGKDDVYETFNLIQHDPRHHRVKVLIDGEQASERLFSEWAMGFQNLDDESSLPDEGYFDFYNDCLPENPLNEAKVALRLLEYFRRNS